MLYMLIFWDADAATEKWKEQLLFQGENELSESRDLV